MDDPSNSGVCNEALVTLASVTPSKILYPERHLRLTKEKPTVRIGRTSKRNNEFQATTTNCYIDSAVMSREHAEISFDVKDQKVYLKDLGSLHGTYYNELKLDQGQSQQLSEGDVMRFGISIERGHETFPPCTMAASINLKTSRTHNRPAVFRVPDDTDVEDLSGDEECGIQHSVAILKENNIRPAPFGVHPSSISIDLTDDNEAPVTATNVDPTSHRVVLHTTNCGGVVDLDSHSEVSFGDDNDDDSDIASDVSEADIPLLEPLEGESVFEQTPTADPIDPQVGLSLSDSPDSDYQSELGSDSEVEDEDDEESMGSVISDPTGECYDEDMSDAFESESVGDKLSEQEDFDEHEDAANVSHDSFRGYMPADVNFVAAPCHVTLTSDIDSHVDDHMEEQHAEVVAQQASLHRNYLCNAPLPSINQTFPVMNTGFNTMDTTGVRLPPIAQTVASHPYLPTEPGFPGGVEALGARTGKYEFFAAREVNRLNAGSLPHVPHLNSTPSSNLPCQSTYDPSHFRAPVFPVLTKCEPEIETLSPAEAREASEAAEMAETEAMEAVEVTEPSQIDDTNTTQEVPLSPAHVDAIDAQGAWASSGEEFLNSPPAAQQTEEKRIDDMPASAYEFEKSKKAAEAEAEAEAQAKVVTEILIESQPDSIQRKEGEINTGSDISIRQPNTPTHSLKRKAEEICHLSEQEEITQTEEMAQPSMLAVTSPLPALSSSIGGQSDRSHRVMRPVKRLRKVAEAVGIAALGGAVVMSALIATAPTF